MLHSLTLEDPRKIIDAQIKIPNDVYQPYNRIFWHDLVDRETALHMAAKRDMLEVAKLLLNFDANKEILNCKNHTPFDVAKSEEMRKLLE